MSGIKGVVGAVAVAVGIAGAAGTADAGAYGRYTYSASRGYSYRAYGYYSATYRTTRYHVAVYRPSQPRYVYYYNSHTRLYWGRYDLDTGLYSVLPAGERKGSLADIPEAAFPPGGAMPGEGDGSLDVLLPPPEADGAGANGATACRK